MGLIRFIISAIYPGKDPVDSIHDTEHSAIKVLEALVDRSCKRGNTLVTRKPGKAFMSDGSRFILSERKDE